MTRLWARAAGSDLERKDRLFILASCSFSLRTVKEVMVPLIRWRHPDTLTRRARALEEFPHLPLSAAGPHRIANL